MLLPNALATRQISVALNKPFRGADSSIFEDAGKSWITDWWFKTKMKRINALLEQTYNAKNLRGGQQKAPCAMGLYALYLKGELIYIGQASSLKKRVYEHQQDLVFDGYLCFIGKEYYQLEDEVIFLTKPACNQQGLTLIETNLHKKMSERDDWHFGFLKLRLDWLLKFGAKARRNIERFEKSLQAVYSKILQQAGCGYSLQELRNMSHATIEEWERYYIDYQKDMGETTREEWAPRQAEAHIQENESLANDIFRRLKDIHYFLNAKSEQLQNFGIKYYPTREKLHLWKSAARELMDRTRFVQLAEAFAEVSLSADSRIQALQNKYPRIQSRLKPTTRQIVDEFILSQLSTPTSKINHYTIKVFMAQEHQTNICVNLSGDIMSLYATEIEAHNQTLT